MINNKKGQLTIFIIIGIVLLFSAALIISVRQAVTEYRPPVEITFEQAPTELQPLQQFVAACVKEVATEAIVKAGTQGGYIDSSKLRINDENPTEAEAISFSPGSSMKIPYWYHMTSSNNCIQNCEFSSKQPPLRGAANSNSLESQISLYVEQKLASCVARFGSFSQFRVEEGDIKATTTIARSDVFVEVDYPLTISAEGRTSTLSKFPAQINIDLGKFYDLAAELANRQSQTGFIDFVTMNTISSYASISEDALPPLAAYTFKPGERKFWFKSEAREGIQQLLISYSPALQATNTQNFNPNFYDSAADGKGVYNIFVLPLSTPHAANAEFSYLPWWPIYFDITPSQGEMISGNSISGFHQVLSAFGLNEYKFAYDISYPLLVTLSDSNSLDGEGFVFQFALESNVRSNEPMRPGRAIVSQATTDQTLACNPQNYKSSNVTVTLRDCATQKPVEDAQVYLRFGAESCLIGNTNNLGVLNSPMPVGIGSLFVTKEGYGQKSLSPFGTSLDIPRDASLTLDPYMTVNVTISRYPVTITKCDITDFDWTNALLIDAAGGVVAAAYALPDRTTTTCTWGPTGTISPGLVRAQQATVTFRKIPETATEEEYSVSVVFNRTQPRKEVSLIPGKYEITSLLIDKEKIIIPKEEIKTDKEWYEFFAPGKQSTDEIPETVLDGLAQGGLKIDSFDIDCGTLGTAKEISINIISTPDGFSIDESGRTNLIHKDLGEAGKYEKYSKDYYEEIKPVFR